MSVHFSMRPLRSYLLRRPKVLNIGNVPGVVGGTAARRMEHPRYTIDARQGLRFGLASPDAQAGALAVNSIPSAFITAIVAFSAGFQCPLSDR